MGSGGCRGWCGCWGAVVAAASPPCAPDPAAAAVAAAEAPDSAAAPDPTAASDPTPLLLRRRCCRPRWCCMYARPLHSARPPFSLRSFDLALVFARPHPLLPLVDLVPARSTAAAGGDGVAAAAALMQPLPLSLQSLLLPLRVRALPLAGPPVRMCPPCARLLFCLW